MLLEILDDDALGKVMEHCNMFDILLCIGLCRRTRMICSSVELWRKKNVECGSRRCRCWLTEEYETEANIEAEIYSARQLCMQYFKCNIFNGRRWLEVKEGSEGLSKALNMLHQYSVLLLHPGHYSGTWKLEANTIIIGLSREGVILHKVLVLGDNVVINNVTIGTSHERGNQSTDHDFSLHCQHRGAIIRNCDIKGDEGLQSEEDSRCLVENCNFETKHTAFKGNGVIKDSMISQQICQNQPYQKTPAIIFYGQGNQLTSSMVNGNFISVLASAGSHCEVCQSNIKAGTYGILVNGSKKKGTTLTICETWVHGCNGAGIYVKGSAAGDIEETNVSKNLIGILVEGWNLPYMKDHRITDKQTKTRPRPSINLSGCTLMENRRNIETISKDHISRLWELQ
eukprot:759214-Hanusia_phi.AAC.2